MAEGVCVCVCIAVWVLRRATQVYQAAYLFFLLSILILTIKPLNNLKPLKISIFKLTPAFL